MQAKQIRDTAADFSENLRLIGPIGLGQRLSIFLSAPLRKYG